jgi:hypothetical protein
MEALRQIANISGYGGLYRILKPSRAGVIVETLDDKKVKTMMGPTARVSVLHDISMYVDTPDQSVALGEVLRAVAETFGDDLPVTSKSSDAELRAFMDEVLPDYDRERVRMSDIKKLVSWYGILRQHAPEVFEAPAGDPAVAEEEQPAADPNPTDDGPEAAAPEAEVAETEVSEVASPEAETPEEEAPAK